MKIAVASSKEMVSEHFGHCEDLNFFEIMDGKVVDEKMLANPNHDCKSLPQFLKDNGMEVLITGGIGKGAMDRCLAQGIEVISGAKGEAKNAAIEFSNGNLKSTGEMCQGGHNHEHDHGHGHKHNHKHAHKHGHGKGNGNCHSH